MTTTYYHYLMHVVLTLVQLLIAMAQLCTIITSRIILLSQSDAWDQLRTTVLSVLQHAGLCIQSATRMVAAVLPLRSRKMASHRLLCTIELALALMPQVRIWARTSRSYQP